MAFYLYACGLSSGVPGYIVAKSLELGQKKKKEISFNQRFSALFFHWHCYSICYEKAVLFWAIASHISIALLWQNTQIFPVGELTGLYRDCGSSNGNAITDAISPTPFMTQNPMSPATLCRPDTAEQTKQTRHSVAQQQWRGLPNFAIS